MPHFASGELWAAPNAPVVWSSQLDCSARHCLEPLQKIHVDCSANCPLCTYSGPVIRRSHIHQDPKRIWACFLSAAHKLKCLKRSWRI